jgi:hypothetical protein
MNKGRYIFVYLLIPLYIYNKMKKSLIIKEEIHTMLKKYCDDKGLKLNKVVESLIIKYVKDGNPKRI